MFWRSPTKKAHQPPSHQEEPIRCFFPQKSTYNSLPPAINVEITVLSAVSPFLRSCTLMASGNAHIIRRSWYPPRELSETYHTLEKRKIIDSTVPLPGDMCSFPGSLQQYLCQSDNVSSLEGIYHPKPCARFFSGKSLKMTIDILHRVSSPPKNGVLFISSV